MFDEVRMPLSAVHDPRLSWGAVGVLTFLASASPHELATDKDLLRRFAGPGDEGKTPGLMVELVEAGYLKIKPDADLDGAFSDIFEIHIQTPNTEVSNA